MRILQSIHNVDVITFQWCLKRKHRALAVTISRWVSFSADGPAYVILGLILLASGHTDFAQLLMLAFLVERGAYKVFKSSFKRNRPPESIPGYKSVIIPSDQFSFPSGHTSAAFLVTTAVATCFPGTLFYVLPWACCVGAARVILGVHFPTDIIAGATLGTSICLLITQFLF